MEHTQTITVIDFETATKAYDSICSVGLVVLKDGDIVDKQHFYVQPPKNKFLPANINIHGITPETTATADLFPAVWDKIKSYFVNSYIAAHNASFDMSALKTTLDTYGIEEPHFLYFDTLHLLDAHLDYGDKRSLDDLCRKFNIPLCEHHDALCDATATARLILHHYNLCGAQNFTQYFNRLYFENFGAVAIKKSISFSKFKQAPTAREVTANTEINVETDDDFNGKTFLFTGDMTSFSREEAMQEVVKRGGIIKDGISKKIDVLVNANPEGVLTGKVKKAMELQAEGHPIKIINEETFLKMIADNNAVEV